MQQGRLRLPSGFSILCSYEFDSEEQGLLDLPSALYAALPKVSEATLVAADGHEESIRISLGAQPAVASFEILEGRLEGDG